MPCVAFVLAVAAQADAQHPDQLIRLRTLLRGRDQAIETLRLPYEAHQAPTSVDCEWREIGSWMMVREERSAIALSGCVERNPMLSWAYWNGVEGFLAGRNAEWTEMNVLDLDATPEFVKYEVARQASSAQLSYAHLPLELGLGVTNVFWGAYIDCFSDVRILGRERIGDIDSLKLLLDMDGRSQDGVYTFPWIVHFDDQRTLLALQVTCYTRDTGAASDAVAASRASLRVDIDGTRWAAQRRMRVESFAEIEPSIWIGTRGTVTRFSEPRDSEIQITIDASRVALNADAPRWLTSEFRPPAESILRH